jgi:YVTN family beta-propeller protein
MHSFTKISICGAFAALTACAGSEASPDLEHRAYVVSRDSDEMTVVDTRTHEVIARVPTGAVAAHMAEVSADFSTVFVSSPDTDEVIVVDARTFEVTGRIAALGHPTHLTLSRGGELLAVVLEDADAVAFVDPETLAVEGRVEGLMTPHFVRWSLDDTTAYIANIGGYHVTPVDVATLTAQPAITLDGFDDHTIAPAETGFADVQIDQEGKLWAAHAASGRVLVYDTAAGAKVSELDVGMRPWIAFAEHPFAELPARSLVPSFDDAQVALIDGGEVVGMVEGDDEAYGVNFSSRTPDRAFVMNRLRQDVAVVDMDAGTIVSRIDVGGTTETAATTPDGAAIVASVSSADRIVFIDPETEAVVTTLDGIGDYPWSVTIPRGQNYCH